MKISGMREYHDEDEAIDIVQDDDGDEVIPPIHQLEAFLDEWSSSPSLNRSEPVDRLYLFRLVITRPLIHRLLPLLRHHQQDDHMDHSTGTTSSDTPVLKFNHVHFYCCCFWSEADTTIADKDDDVCTPEDKLSFLSAIARLRGSLWITRSREILSGLLSFPDIDQLEVQDFSLFQRTQLPESEFVRLGALIQRSVQTTKLSLKVFFEDSPQEFYDYLANSIHIQDLSFGYIRNFCSPWPLREASMTMSKLIIGDDGNGALERLLRNPQSQLIRLDLNKTYLEDHRLIAIAQLLPHSKVENFSFNFNWIHPPVLLEFIRQIPNMRSLSAVSFGLDTLDEPITSNEHTVEVVEEFWEELTAWEETSVTKESTQEVMEDFGEESTAFVIEELGAALLECVMKNPSITYLGGLYPMPARFPRLIFHYQSLNCGGRKILVSHQHQSHEQEVPTTGSPIPDGLWPHILARAGRRELYKSPETWHKHNGPANAVYFFLQNITGILFGQ